MPMYALATISVITNLKDNVDNVTLIWYADDAVGAGKVSSLRDWWDHIFTIGVTEILVRRKFWSGRTKIAGKL